MPGHVFRHETREPAVLLPGNDVRGIRRVDDIGGLDAGGELLVEPLEQPLRAGTFDLYGNARIGRLERLAELFADRQVHRRIENQLAFLLRGLDQVRRDRDRLRRLRPNWRREHAAQRQRGRTFEDIAATDFSFHHFSSLAVIASVAKQSILVWADAWIASLRSQ